MHKNSAIWMRMMLIAFVANGIGPFGLKVVIEQKLGAYQPQYLVYFYAGTLLLGLVALLSNWARPNLREVLIGGGMGLSSLLGQQFMGMAFSHGAPGHIVFPVTTGGTLFVVGAVGMVFFRERVGPCGVAGIVLGIASILLLGMA